MDQQTGQKANSALLESDKLYLKRAREILPYLVRQAKAGQTIYYSDLAQEVNIPNPRNLNYPLGAIGNTLIELGKRYNTEIPAIQCLVINKNTGFPGEGIGWFISKEDFSKLNKSQKEMVIKNELIKIYTFPKWDWVLEQLELKPVKTEIIQKPSEIIQELNEVKSGRGGGESPQHLQFKNFIANNPAAVGLGRNVKNGKTEYPLPSLDEIDVLFADNDLVIGVEVKSVISDSKDIERGIFQCVKYKALLEAEQRVEGKIPNCRVILALEGILPTELIVVKNILGIEVIDNIKKV